MFDAEKTKNDIVNWIREWFRENGEGCRAVIGISGGKDSSVVAALCAEALGKDRVLGVMMPRGEQFDIDVSRALIKHLGIEGITVNVEEACNAVEKQVQEVFKDKHSASGKNDNALCCLPDCGRQSCQHLQSFRGLCWLQYDFRRQCWGFQPSVKAYGSGG